MEKEEKETKENKENKKEKKEEKVQKHNSRKLLFFICLAILIIILLILFGTKIYLWVQFLFGNDIIINVEATPKNIFLANSEEKTISLTTSIIANPFCDTTCTYEFKDISNNISIEQREANIKTLNSLNKEYTLTAPAKKTGQVLYRFDIQCKSTKSFLCQTSGELNKRTFLVTLNYNLSEDQQIEKKKFKENYLKLVRGANEKILFINQIEEDIDFSLWVLDANEQAYSLQELITSINKAAILWDEQEYLLANSLLEQPRLDYENIESEFNNFNQSLHEKITKYNQLSLSLDYLVENVSYITNLSLNETDIHTGENIVKSTNKIISILNTESIIFQESNISELQLLVNAFLISTKENSSGQEKINISVAEYTPQFINLNFSVSSPDIELKDPSPECCLFNKCYSCCDESCYNNPEKYPVVFIHGHDFSSSISPEYNLNIFEEMQRAIEDEGYLNSGTLILGSSETNGLLGKISGPVSLKASYYFDSIQEADKINVLYTKQDNIDTYAVRLNEIIEEIKLSTNREKVILITHSMGGLVARRYIRVFGDDSIYKIILIAAPNHGINKELYDSCTLFGSDDECDDMYKESLVISKLNSQTDLGDIKTYNIIGLGRETYGEDGDGVVQESSAFLDFAENHYITGNCTGSFDFFHNRIINPLKTPEIKEVVLKILKEN